MSKLTTDQACDWIYEAQQYLIENKYHNLSDEDIEAMQDWELKRSINEIYPGGNDQFVKDKILTT